MPKPDVKKDRGFEIEELSDEARAYIEKIEGAQVELETKVETAETAVTEATGKVDGLETQVTELTADVEKLKKVDPKDEDPTKGMSKAQKTEFDLLVKRNEESTARIATLEKARRTERFQKVAEEHTDVLPVTPEELGEVLDVIDGAATPEQKEIADKVFKAAAEAARQAKALKQIGSDQEPGGGDAWAKIENMAKERVLKSANPLTVEQATRAIIEEQPDLYNTYLAETRQQ